jgi:hypothetical protein
MICFKTTRIIKNWSITTNKFFHSKKAQSPLSQKIPFYPNKAFYNKKLILGKAIPSLLLSANISEIIFHLRRNEV